MEDAGMTHIGEVGMVMSLWRYPVKSMRGEEVSITRVGGQGLVGDRAYAVMDRLDGKIATTKNPRKWANLFAFRATFIEEADQDGKASSVSISLPDGMIVSSEQEDLDRLLSKALNRNVSLVAAGQSRIARSEEYWPDIDGREHRDTVTDFTLPSGTFFDAAMVHLVTTSTLARLHELYPQGRFEIPRFRPNIVVKPVGIENGFVESDWIGRILAIGEEVRLQITEPCGRCVMTTLAQNDLPKDPGILRTAVQHHQGEVGVYASVTRGGTIRRGDRVKLEI
jgi:uncharacterized protein